MCKNVKPICQLLLLQLFTSLHALTVVLPITPPIRNKPQPSHLHYCSVCLSI